MKKRLILFAIGMLCCALTGCIDIVQHITRKGDGIEQNIIRITVSKQMFEVINSITDKEETLDYEQFFEEYNLQDTDILQEYEAFSIKTAKIDNIFDIGYIISMAINYKDLKILEMLKNHDIDFVPEYDKTKLSLSINTLHDDAQPVDKEMVLFFVNSKYRLLISKACMPSISTVMVTAGKKSEKIDFVDLFDEYLIEIPLMLFFEHAIQLDIYR